MSLLLLTAGAAPAGPADLFANATGYFATLTGSATGTSAINGNALAYFAPLYGTSDAELFPFEIDKEFIPGGEGRESFQSRILFRQRRITATAVAHLAPLTGRGRAHVTPAFAAGGPLPKRTERIRPPEEEREFRILARARGKLAPLSGQAVGQSRVLAAADAPFEPLRAWAKVEQSWPDDTAELVAIMLMVDQEAA